MKKFVVILIFSLLSLSLVFSLSLTEKKVQKDNTESDTLIVYAYDSFCGDYGPGKELSDNFYSSTGIKVKLVECGSAVEMYNRILYEGDNCPADVVIGLPDTIDIDSSMFYHFEPPCKFDLIDYDTSTNLIPFNYGVFSFLYNREINVDFIPDSLLDLTNSSFRNSIILIDPRTSSVGLGLLIWTVEALGTDNALKWWKEISQNTLTISDSWSSAYGLFTENEAPFVISYTTSPVYHVLNEGYTTYKPLEFKEGHIRTTEYLGILSNSKNKHSAELFSNFLLTEGQELIAIYNSMFPANKTTKLDNAFDSALMPTKILNRNKNYSEQEINSLIKLWTNSVI